MRKTERWIAAALALAALACAYWSLARGPMVGVADNGDFLRVMKTVGFDYAEPGLTYGDKYFDYAIFAYRDVPVGFGGYVSTHLLFLFAAKAANALATGGFGGTFRLGVLGAVYAATFAGAVALIYTGLQAKRAVRLAVAAALVAVYSDIGYAAYYHSFYGEPASMLGFLLAIGAGLHAAKAGGRRRLWWFFAAIVLFVGAKAQNFAVGLVFFAVLARWRDPARAIGAPASRRLALALSAGALLLGFAVYAATPKELKRINLYQTVFYGILKHSDDVPADLRELGLPETLAPLAGTNFFEAGTAMPQTSPALDALFYDRVSHADVALYYARHPGKLYERVAFAAAHATTIRPYYLGSFAKEAGREAGAVQLEGGWWSEWKKERLPRSVGFATAVGALYLAMLSSRGIASAAGLRAPAALYAVPGVAAVAYVTPLVGDGDADLAKHLFLYNVAFDFMAWFAAAVAIGMLVSASVAAGRRLRRRASVGRAA
ncbi:hypothetical protein [Paenibacillus sp.]|uniref:glycan biosynthesis hexose transferase WsfD n=1 Tax=Paenibacillus sp. TaxID=58172 RepID=UPI002D6BE116|nr:hypothetical protein [Paenibacillus sp.]HZG57991.1 hypothetical protein [Paenibacillus sp.]